MGGDLSLLMALRVQGLATADRAALASDLEVSSAAARLTKLEGAELVRRRAGKREGFTLTSAGVDLFEKLLAEEGLRTSESLAAAYERFMLINPRVLEVCSAWQLRSGDGTETPNDHSDFDYDASVIDRLSELHRRSKTCIGGMAERAKRYACYVERLDSCLDRLHAGDRAAFTAPLTESYHTVWFELHQDLILTLGLKREV